MTDNNTDTATSRVTTRSVTAAAAAAAAAASTSINTTTLSSRGTSMKTGQERLAQLYPHIGDDTRLPSKWNSKDKATSLTLQQNDLVVTYKGPGKSHKDAASVRADHPIPPLTGIYYFEIHILSKGRDGYMGIGLSTSDVNLQRLPGWDKGSYGYHGDDGHSFCSSGSGIVYGPTFTTNDIVGCCVNFLDNSCFYTLNGQNLGTSFRDIPAEVYPTIGLQTPNESILANFGHSPFKFDIEKYMDEYREKTRRAIIENSIKENEVLHQTQLRRIVSTYLVHYGYCATAEQFNKNAESFYADELNSMRNRQLIQHLILEGRTTDAIEKTKELFPTLLNDRNLLFLLKVRQFIEMVNGTESEIIDKSKSTSPPSPATNHSRSKSPYNGIRHRRPQEHTNGTNDSAQVNQMEMDVTTTNATNGFNHHETVAEHANGFVSNGHSTKSNDLLDGMEYDGETPAEPPITSIESNSSHDDQLLIRILQFGRELHALKQQLTIEYGENPHNDKILQDAFSLLAYSDPKSSPLAYLLEPSQRETVSSAVNSAILEAHDMPRHPALEVLVGYLNECDKLMRKNNIPDCAYIDLKRYVR